MDLHDQIAPFAGLRYVAAKAGKIEDLLAPPYDVIYPDMRDALYLKSPFNVTRLILGKTSESDSATDNRYTRAAAYLDRWTRDGVLARDEWPAVYLYSQTYDSPEGPKTRVGFMARKRLEEFGGSVVPHENTFAGPKADRLELTRACKCNFSPIFGLYTDPSMSAEQIQREVMRSKPDVEAKMDDGQTHRMWVVTDTARIKAFAGAVGDKKILIADGHHRYETALNYLKENSVGGKRPTNEMRYVLMYFTNTESEGLSVFATHRVVNHLEAFDPGAFSKKLSLGFDVEKISSGSGKRDEAAEKKMLALMAKSPVPAFGLYSGGGDYGIIRLKKASSGGLLEGLDVAILHEKILAGMLGVRPQTDMAHQQIYYGQDVAKCAARVDDGTSKLAFFLNPTPIKQMREISLAGLKMPQKSTYFYPKLITGLVINPLY
ncbi:MAG: DUF1015 domain-containing protein [Nitrospinae bacterium]|nr:DUF1015 domain-containing protein [Nitrospinota bacterium]